MSRLTGLEILCEVAAGYIKIDPYDAERVQDASIDLRLGSQVRFYSKQAMRTANPTGVVPFPVLLAAPLDSRLENETSTFELKDGEKMLLTPGVLYLMHTVERLHTMKYEVDVTGKSSLGRLGIIVHHTAGHIDPGFDGQYTLEVAVVHPVYVYQGMPFCQARFHSLQGEVTDYRKRGNYTGEAALGAQASRSWNQK